MANPQTFRNFTSFLLPVQNSIFELRNLTNQTRTFDLGEVNLQMAGLIHERRYQLDIRYYADKVKSCDKILKTNSRRI